MTQKKYLISGSPEPWNAASRAPSPESLTG